MKKILVLILVMAAAFSIGCSKKNTREKLAPELAQEAMESFEKERYQSAIETFNKLKDWYPFDKLATLAEFKIAEAHYKMEEYEEAISAYREFEKLHPKNEAIPYILNQIAMCYFNRMDTVDRDQNNARHAIESFDRVIKEYPDTEYARNAVKNREKCMKSLAGQEIYVGRFYFKSKHYNSALARFKTVLSQYPGLGYDKEARDYMDKCEVKIKEQPKDKSGRYDEMIIVPE